MVSAALKPRWVVLRPLINTDNAAAVATIERLNATIATLEPLHPQLDAATARSIGLASDVVRLQSSVDASESARLSVQQQLNAVNAELDSCKHALASVQVIRHSQS